MTLHICEIGDSCRDFASPSLEKQSTQVLGTRTVVAEGMFPIKQLWDVCHTASESENPYSYILVTKIRAISWSYTIQGTPNSVSEGTLLPNKSSR